MSRRILAALTLVAACSSFSACAEPLTAPQRPPLTPTTPRGDALDTGTCNSGWISTEGRCAGG